MQGAVSNIKNKQIGFSKTNGLDFLPECLQDVGRDFTVNNLSIDEQKIPITDINLGQFQKAKSFADIYNTLLQEFFKDCDYRRQIDSDNIGSYLHNLLQYNMFSFFTEKVGFQFLGDCLCRDERLTEARKLKAECGLDENFSAYSDAFIFFAKDDERLVIEIERGLYQSGTYYYELFYAGKQNLLELTKEWISYSKKHNFYKNQKINADCEFLKLSSDLSWNDIILADKTQKIVENNITELFDITGLLRKNNISLKRGVILAGPPGTGKTLICKVLAHQLDVTVLYILPSHIRDKRDVSRICDMAKDLAPTLLILEDIDYIAEDREERGGWPVIDLMNKMDGLEDFTNVITLATTNHVDKVERAIKNRPGRFDRIIQVPNPDKECLKRMLDKFTEDLQLSDDVNINSTVKKCEGMSGAFVKDVVKTSVFNAIREHSLSENDVAILKQEHFDLAIDEIKDKDFTQYYEVEPKTPLGFAARRQSN